LDYDDRITNRILEKTIQVVFPEESIRKIIAEQREREILNG
jgi:DNA replication protein DnaC